MKILFIGDVVSGAGLSALKRLLPELRKKHSPDLVVANGENAAKGFGITPANLKAMVASGVDVITGGNHSFDKREIAEVMSSTERLLRPANYPEGTPGRGWCVVNAGGEKVGVVSLMGRVFMAPAESPFRVAEEVLEKVKAEGAAAVLVDFHAEATSEKMAMGHYLDGRVSAVVGTHTHVPTADARILPGGTGYVTDAGMTGDRDSVIGIEKKSALRRFLTGLPTSSPSAEGKGTLMGVLIEIEKGRCTSIRRIEETEP